MKKSFLVVFSVAVFALALLFGCSNSSGGNSSDSSSPKTYDVEHGTISDSDCNSIVLRYKRYYTDYDYGDVLDIKYACVAKTIGKVEREFGVSETEIKDSLQGTMTTAEVKMFMDSLNERGNTIFFGRPNDGSTNKVWIYVATQAK